ncbi:hypothetical protein [Serratia microhaemolytica]|uniref:hypothetical protein n=1 Tax=Serratia microhaemolytica TaxID=2675110 RepID=UPI000FDD84CB|nr:hypothetical protein [Serratia microhaemolytica]
MSSTKTATAATCQDEAIEDDEQVMPCQIPDMIMTIDDPAQAKDAFSKISSPLSMEMEDIPLEGGGPEELANEEALPEGVSFSSVMAHVQAGKNSRNAKIKALANEISDMDKLFDKVHEKIGVEEFPVFLALFSASARSGEKGKWQITRNGKKHDINKAVFRVTYLPQHHYYPTVARDELGPSEVGDNVYTPHSTWLNDDFEIIVTPEYIQTDGTLWTYTHPTRKRTLDELADLLIKEIYNIVERNNLVDWWSGKALTAAEVLITIASVFSGVGIVLRAGHLAIRATAALTIVVQGSNTIDAASRFIGVSEQGYNPLLAAARYLDGKQGSKYEAAFHAANLMMMFGKSGVVKTLTALGSGAGGARLFYMTKEYTLTEQPIQALEDPRNYPADSTEKQDVKP